MPRLGTVLVIAETSKLEFFFGLVLFLRTKLTFAAGSPWLITEISVSSHTAESHNFNLPLFQVE